MYFATTLLGNSRLNLFYFFDDLNLKFYVVTLFIFNNFLLKSYLSDIMKLCNFSSA